MSTLLRALKTTGIAAAWFAILVFMVGRAPFYEHPFAWFGSMVLTVIAVEMTFSFVNLVFYSFTRHLMPHRAG